MLHGGAAAAVGASARGGAIHARCTARAMSGNKPMKATTSESTAVETDDDITYIAYDSEHYLQGIIDLISVDLSEPYSIFTYRYFINNWPELTFLALMPAPVEGLQPIERGLAGSSQKQVVVGCIVNKQDQHRSGSMRGYIAMLAVHHSVRKRGIGRKLVQLAVRAMRDSGADEAVLETEECNVGALRLYEGLGFVRDKRLPRYYLNGNDAYRLKVWFNDLEPVMAAGDEAGTAEEDDPGRRASPVIEEVEPGRPAMIQMS